MFTSSESALRLPVIALLALAGLTLATSPATTSEVSIAHDAVYFLDPPPLGSGILAKGTKSFAVINEGNTVKTWADADQDGTPYFEWGRGPFTPLMTLNSAGKLSTDGGYGSFGAELAQAFLRSGTLTPGDLVRTDPDRSRAVLASRGIEGEVVIGVVAASPGLVGGGGILTAEALERGWGREVAERFQADLAALQAEILQARSDWSLESAELPLDGPARQRLESEIERAALDLFVERALVPVVLSGVARVKVDSTPGEIRPGDPLAASPSAGTAQRARQPGPVFGTALEGLAAGTGTIPVLLHHGWYPGDGVRPIAGVAPPDPPTLPVARASTAGGEAGRDAVIQRLISRIESLERRLAEVEAKSAYPPRRTTAD